MNYRNPFAFEIDCQASVLRTNTPGPEPTKKPPANRPVADSIGISSSIAHDQDEQVIVIRYKKNSLMGDNMSSIHVGRPFGANKDDEVALCCAVGKILQEDIPELDAVTTSKTLAIALTSHITEFLLEAIKEAGKYA